MRIVVPALEADCPAHKALESEGVKHEVHLMDNDYSYGELIDSLWGTEFIIVEHDIVPWIGAIEELKNCKEDYCGFYYMIARKLGGTLGCTKFNFDFPIGLKNTHWTQVDGKIASAILKHTGKDDFHVHNPPVAHLHVY